jgi:trk system potassium uptake protein TrkA
MKGPRADMLEDEFGHRVVHGDGTELYVLEAAGITRPPDIVVAVTGDDEDNMIIAQLAREKYGVSKVIARVNDPRNQVHFDLLGISPTICPTLRIMALIEHEVPEHEVVHLLELRRENLEIIEVEVDPKCPCIGKTVEALGLPSGSRLVSLVRDGKAELVVDGTVLRPGDQLIAILEPGREEEVRELLLGR